MFQILSKYFKIIQYQICYYFLGIFAVLDDLKNRDKNKFGKTIKCVLINTFRVFDEILKLSKNILYIRFFIKEIIKKRGKVAVITGGARGIGLEVVKKLVQCEMHIVIGNLHLLLNIYLVLVYYV